MQNCEKKIVLASDNDIPMSPFLGIVIGAIVTIIILILLIALRIRNQTVSRDKPVEQKMVPMNMGAQTGQINVVKNTLNRSVSPREIDERDPDVIPAKYGNYIYQKYIFLSIHITIMTLLVLMFI